MNKWFQTHFLEFFHLLATKKDTSNMFSDYVVIFLVRGLVGSIFDYVI